MVTGRQRARRRCEHIAAALLAAASALGLSGCGASARPSTNGALGSTVPAYVTEPFTHEQQLVQQGARLVIADGCAACHLSGSTRSVPSFSSFAGHRVTLADGRRILVDEHFLRESLLRPRTTELRGYDPTPMLAALARIHVRDQPQQIAALAAFIEQIGPESG